jgi:hypothetical protein
MIYTVHAALRTENTNLGYNDMNTKRRFSTSILLDIMNMDKLYILLTESHLEVYDT